ncbi:MAG: TIGR04086 family membrane protein [Firmicutes bacterium]|nr:TIGR04086 family membrane protein [Bacillota bacterium]
MKINSRIDTGGGKSSRRSLLLAALKGLAVSICVAVIVSIIMTIIIAGTRWLKLGTSSLLLVNCLSIAIGGVYAAKSLGESGWLVGLSVGALYGLLALFFGGLGIGEEVLAVTLRHGAGGVVVSALVGTVAGMIGVNLK